MARRIATTLGVPLLELDALQHRPDWEPAPLEEFRSEISEFIDRCEQNGSGFVLDGNYRQHAGDIIDANVDTVVWLDYPRWLITSRIVRRTAGRILARRELWNGNRETLRLVLSRDPQQSIIAWSWTNFAAYRDRYTQAAAGSDGPAYVRLHTPREARRWLRELSVRSDRRAARG